MKTSLRNKLLLLSSSFLLCAYANADTATGNITATGTIVAANICSLTVPATVDFGTKTNNAYLDQSFSVTVNCTSGLNYSLSSPADRPVTIGSGSHFLTVINAGNNSIQSTPTTGTGTGANETKVLAMRLHGAVGSLTSIIPVPSIGTFSATVGMSLAY
jgi:hypothetical protein